MATVIIEKVVAGEDAAKSQQDLAEASVSTDTNQPSKEFLEAREARAREEAEMNLSTNALIFPLPGETIATRAIVLPDDEAKNVEGGVRVVEKDAFIAASAEAAKPNFEKLDEGETEEAVDSPDKPTPTTIAPSTPSVPTPSGTVQTSPATSSSVPGSGTDGKMHDGFSRD